MPEQSRTEADALAALAEGDRKRALTVLMRGYGTTLYQFCRNALRDDGLAEDVHQQVFVQAYTDLARFSGRSTLKTWLFSIAHHRCLDVTRQNRRFAARFTVGEVPTEVPDPTPSPDESLARGAIEKGIARCLEALAPATRMAVRLRYSEGFTYEQMAAICSEKPGTLQARVARALPVVRRCLQKGGYEP